MTIKNLIHWANSELTEGSKSPQLDAEVLLAHVLKKPVTFLLTHNEQKISSIKRWKFKKLIQKRKQGIPVAQLAHSKEFYFLDFYVNRHVLIPRPDTEILVESVLKHTKSSPLISHLSLLDVGTGSGCIPISILKSMPNLQGVAVDISKKALKVAQKNAKRHMVSDQLKLIHSDLLEKVDPQLFADKEIVLTANLPYLPIDYRTDDLDHEPELALYSGEKGLDHYFKLIAQISLIKPKIIFFECFNFQVPLILEKTKNYQKKAIKKMTGQAVCLIMEKK